jgi:hypothetical protein
VLPEDEAPSAELSALREQLGEIREAARKQHNVAGALLNSRCYIKSIEGDTVELGFQFPIHVEKAEGNPEALAAIREAVGGALGRSVRVVPVVWDALQQAPPAQQQRAEAPSGAGAAGAPPPAGEAPAAGGHLVEEARKLGAVPIEE